MKKLTILLVILLLWSPMWADDVSVRISSGRETVMSNGLLSITIGNNGRISKMSMQGDDNVLASNGVYFDYTSNKNRSLNPTKVEIVRQTKDYVEVVYSNLDNSPQLEQGFIMRKGISGVYVYIVVHGTTLSESVNMREMRVCTRLAPSFINGYVDDNIQGRIPSNSEMKTAEKAENKVADATYRMADGSIYTKYDWTQYIVKDSVHGLMSENTGVWNIACSHEWVNGGPMKQELTVHATSKSPITIQMLQGEHLGASSQTFTNGEHKLYGPFLIYLNKGTHQQMISDAKAVASQQQKDWPFNWFVHELFPLNRPSVHGNINVTTGQSKESIQVVLAESGSDVYSPGKRYIYWGKTDEDGHFCIKDVRPGDYALYAYATHGDVTDELVFEDVHVGNETCHLGVIDWTPSKHGKLLWMIGENNRLSDGFALSDAPRSYLLPEKVPADLVFTIGDSNPQTDWYYAQTKKGVWAVRFRCDQAYLGQAYLTASLAAVTSQPTIQVSLNGIFLDTWQWNSNDGAIYRSATQSGRHGLKTLCFDASILRQGENLLEFNLTNGNGRGGVMWDCIKMETYTTIEDGINTVNTIDCHPVFVYRIDGTPVTTFTHRDAILLPPGIYICKQRVGNRDYIFKLAGTMSR